MIDWGQLYVAAASLPLLAGLPLLRANPGPWPRRLAVAALAVTLLFALAGLFAHDRHVQTSKAQLLPVQPWAGSATWLRLSQLGVEDFGKLGYPPDAPAAELWLGYHVDALTTVLFAVVASLALAAVLAFYGSREGSQLGRASLLTAALLHLLIADNLFQVFLTWTLFGLLLGGPARTPLFTLLLHRVGDVGLLLGTLILLAHTGTTGLVTVREFQRDETGQVVYEDGQAITRIARLSVFDALRAPTKDSHDEPFAEPGAEAGKFIRVTPARTSRGKKKLQLAPDGPLVVVWNQDTLNGHYDKPDRGRFDAFDPHGAGGHGKGLRAIPYPLLCLAGFGILLGCFAKTGQVPFHGGLLNATAGPGAATPLIPAFAILSGIYVAARTLPVFTTEVLLALAYLGPLAALLAAHLASRRRETPEAYGYLVLVPTGIAFAALGTGGWTSAVVQVSLLACLAVILFLGHAVMTNGRRTTALWVVGAVLPFLVLLPLLPGTQLSPGPLTYLISFVGLEPRHLLIALLAVVALALAAMTTLVLYVSSTVSHFINVAKALLFGERTRVSETRLWPVLLPLLTLGLLLGAAGTLSQAEPAAATEEGPLALNDVAQQVTNGYFMSATWLRGLHEQSGLGPRGVAFAALVLALLLVPVPVILLRWRALISSSRGPSEVDRGFRLNQPERLYDRGVAVPARTAAGWLDTFDRRLWPALLDAGVKGLLGLATLARAIDDHVIGGVPRGLGWVAQRLTGRTRRAQGPEQTSGAGHG